MIQFVPVIAFWFLSGWAEPASPPATTPQKQQPDPGSSGFRPRNPRYGVRPGDSLELSFSRMPEFNQTVSVQPDGYITLREAGDLYVQGKTVPDLQKDIGAAYAKILREPVLTVLLKDFEKPHFTVGGQVGRPGKYDLRDDATVSEAIAIAGGFTERAKHSQVLLFRRVSDEWVEVKVLDLKAMYDKRRMQEDIHLRPGDMVVVPQNRVSKIKPFLPVWGLSTYLDPARF